MKTTKETKHTPTGKTRAMKSAVKVKRVRVQWPDAKGRLRWIWAYRVGDEPPQLTPRLARVEWERSRRIRAHISHEPRTHEVLMNTPLVHPANCRRSKALAFAAMLATTPDIYRAP